MNRPEGVVTRGTTNPNRLRRVDRWIARRAESLLRRTPEPLVIDLGYGASPVTTLQWYRSLAATHPHLRMLGLEIDPGRVAFARRHRRERLDFALGGFELAGHRPHLVRAMNVLRQYDEPAVADAWRRIGAALAPGGFLVEGTCDEIGRLACWVLVDRHGPRTLTLAADLAHLDTPATLAQRLPKALIHHNVPGQPIGDLIAALDEAWRRNAPSAVFGPRDRWRRTLDRLVEDGLRIHETPARRRDGTVTVDWADVAAQPLPVLAGAFHRRQPQPRLVEQVTAHQR